MRRAFSFFIGSLLGGLIGASVALLYTPLAGKDLRLQVMDRCQSFSASIREAASSKRIELQERLEILRAPRK